MCILFNVLYISSCCVDTVWTVKYVSVMQEDISVGGALDVSIFLKFKWKVALNYEACNEIMSHLKIAKITV